MNYQIVFDAAKAGYTNWPFAATGLVFVCLGAFLVKNRRRISTMFPGTPPKMASVFPFVFLGFAVLWTTVAFTGTVGEYAALRSAIKQGNVEVAEGRVEDFVPMPYEGHAMEHFSVCGVPFSYSDYVVTAGFNHTSSHGGPIRPGLWVRLTYVNSKNNTIGRVEIATTDPGPQAECHRPPQ